MVTGEFHVNLITRPSPKRTSDLYTRVDMQWPRMCEAVLCIDAGAWAVAGVTAGFTEPGAEKK